jgi:hypothetical protein
MVVEIPVAIGCLDKPLVFSFFSDFLSLVGFVEPEETEVTLVKTELVGEASKSSEPELVDPSGVNSFRVAGVLEAFVIVYSSLRLRRLGLNEGDEEADSLTGNATGLLFAKAILDFNIKQAGTSEQNGKRGMKWKPKPKD